MPAASRGRGAIAGKTAIVTAWVVGVGLLAVRRCWVFFPAAMICRSSGLLPPKCIKPVIIHRLSQKSHGSQSK